MSARVFAALILALTVAFPVVAGPLPGPVILRRIDATGFPLPNEVVRRLGTPTHYATWTWDLAYAPDGKSVITSGFGIQRIDVATGKPHWTAQEFKPYWPRLAISSDRTSVWAIGQRYHENSNQYSLEIRRFALADGQLLDQSSIRNVHQDALRNEVSASGRVVFVDDKNALTVVEGATGRVVGRASDYSEVWSNCWAITPDGTKLALVEAGPQPSEPMYSIRVVDIATKKTLHTFAAAITQHVRFSHDGQTLYALMVATNHCPRPAIVQSWDVKSGKGLAAFSAVSSRQGCDVPNRFILSPDGKRLATTGWSSEFIVHDTGDGRIVSRTVSLTSKAAAFSPDSKTLAAGTNPVTFWNPETCKLLPDSPRTAVAQFARGLQFTDHGRRVIGLSGNCDDIIEWEVATGREVARRDWAEGYPRGYYGFGAWGGHSGHTVISRSLSGLIAAAVLRLDKPDDPDHGTIAITNEATGKLVQRLPSPSGHSDEIVFTHDDRSIITMQSRTAIVWDLATGKEAFRPKLNDENTGSSQGAPRIHLSPDGRHVAIHDLNATEDGGRWSVGILDLEAKQLVRRFHGPGRLYRFAWSEDGKRLALLGGSLFLVDRTSDRMILNGEASNGDWYGVGLSPDGRTLATPAQDGSIRLREAATGKTRQTFVGHRSMSSALQFTPDGRYLASDGPEGPVFLWDVRGELSRSAPPDAATLERAWMALASDDAKAAFRAIRELAAYPEHGVPFLAKKVDAIPRPRTDHIPQLIAQLGDDAFAVRERAEKELRDADEAAIPALTEALRDRSPEVRGRAKRILEAPQRMTPERLRAIRCVETVGWMETREAKLLLAKWAAGAYLHGLSAEAKSVRAGSLVK